MQTTTPPQPPHHLVLTQEQSAVFHESGIGFAIAAVSESGQTALLMFECDRPAAIAASAVAMGTHSAVKKKPARAQPTNPAGP